MKFCNKIRKELIETNYPVVIKINNLIGENTVDGKLLSRNRNAIDLLERNVNKVDWHKIDWVSLSMNPNAIHLLEEAL